MSSRLSVQSTRVNQHQVTLKYGCFELLPVDSQHTAEQDDTRKDIVVDCLLLLFYIKEGVAQSTAYNKPRWQLVGVFTKVLTSPWLKPPFHLALSSHNSNYRQILLNCGNFTPHLLLFSVIFNHMSCELTIFQIEFDMYSSPLCLGIFRLDFF